MLEKCDVDDENGDMAFSCRAFVVRYRDEIHELNDAVHWRLTIPKVTFLYDVYLLILLTVITIYLSFYRIGEYVELSKSGKHFT